VFNLASILASILLASVGVIGFGELTMVFNGMPPLVVGEGNGCPERGFIGDGVML